MFEWKVNGKVQLRPSTYLGKKRMPTDIPQNMLFLPLNNIIQLETKYHREVFDLRAEEVKLLPGCKLFAMLDPHLCNPI